MLDTIWKKHKDRLSGDAMREYKYFRGNAGRMEYDVYRANGWFVGSGVIESACKTVIGQRFKQSGMIWSLKGAKALLPLRTPLQVQPPRGILPLHRQEPTAGRLRGMTIA